jgi:peptidoglycan/xylan/chitin deacetylase (PgdA/CDA1 family)
MPSRTLFILVIWLIHGCNSDVNEKPPQRVNTDSLEEKPIDSTKVEIADAATILSRKEVPVLCYHRIRNFKGNESASMINYIVPPDVFKEQIKSLADSGYQTITADQYYNYLTSNEKLPAKPVMITFDDTSEEQFTVGAAEMDKYGFKGVYFIMTISIGRPGYMTSEQLKELADKGHTIAAHTWDHHRVTKYSEEDWNKQLTESKQTIESITGKPVHHFAYPFGLWNKAAIPELKKREIKTAYQLAAKRDTLEPLYTIRRMLVPGTWDRNKMHKWMNNNFK